MGKRKNLNDAIYGDRASVRAHNFGSSSATLFDFQNEGHRGAASKTFKDDNWSSGERCYKSHPALKLPGTELVIYGGSCINPVVADADIYIGFDGGMTFTGKQFPWSEGHEILFRITDMSVPKDVSQFKKLVDWTGEQLAAGKKVHCGCIGGHGRTGTFLAALVSAHGEKDAIEYVRTHYCKKAVESTEQIKFLAKTFGITEAKGSKSWGGSTSYNSGSSKSRSVAGKVERYKPLGGNGCIWDK